MGKPKSLETELKTELAVYLGIPPYNTPGNFHWHDPYYIADIRKRYGDEAVDQELKKLGLGR